MLDLSQLAWQWRTELCEQRDALARRLLHEANQLAADRARLRSHDSKVIETLQHLEQTHPALRNKVRLALVMFEVDRDSFERSQQVLQSTQQDYEELTNTILALDQYIG